MTRPFIFLTLAAAVVSSSGGQSKAVDVAAVAQARRVPAKTASTRDWSRVVAVSSAGGFVMGNPNARVKLIEFGSMTCSHCADFDADGADTLIAKYVKRGQVSWEFRNHVRDGLDVTASLIARCGGTQNFFPMTRSLFKEQRGWIEKVQAAPAAQLEQLRNRSPAARIPILASLAGLPQWAAARGLPASKSASCLANMKSADQLVQMVGNAREQYGVSATPTFVLNGKALDGTAIWGLLEPQIIEALGR